MHLRTSKTPQTYLQTTLMELNFVFESVLVVFKVLVYGIQIEQATWEIQLNPTLPSSGAVLY